MKQIGLVILVGLVTMLSAVGCGGDAGSVMQSQSNPPATKVAVAVESSASQSPAKQPPANQPATTPVAPAQPRTGGATPASPSGAPQNQPGARGGGPGISGTVKSVSGATIQVTAQDGNAITVNTNAQTTYQKETSATLADVQVGVRVIVASDTSGATVTARSIQISSGAEPGFGAPPQGAGQPGGVPPQGAGQPGGAPSAQGTPLAGTPPNPGSGQAGRVGGPGVGGTVKSVSGATIQVTAPDGSTITVNTNTATTFFKQTSATLADVKAGERVTILGEQSGVTITARTIQIGGGSR